MNVFSIAVFCVCAAVLAVLVPVYVNCLSNKKPYKLKKMICSSLFLLQALAAVLYNGGFSVFSALMLAGLVLSWIGDLFLAVSLKGTPFILGLASFLLAHVMYVISFSRSISDISKSAMIKPFEIAVVIIMLIVCLIVKKKAEIKLGEMAIPVLFYALAISFMLARACRLSLLCAQNEMMLV
ncbi:MAG: lysoplasmalogenase, partial [Acutalibacteraceae bacterium]